MVISAVVAVNAAGNVFDRRTGRFLAGTLDPTQPEPVIIDPVAALALMQQESNTQPPLNTTIGCVMTNACLSKAQASRVATMTHDGYARAIEPVHTSNDGDVVFVLATKEREANPDIVGIYAALVMEYAIHDAVLQAHTSHSLRCARDLIAQDRQ
jgi:L-aminopeptidase/D-esterase-like protein